jgi:hypothetical protein
VCEDDDGDGREESGNELYGHVRCCVFERACLTPIVRHGMGRGLGSLSRCGHTGGSRRDLSLPVVFVPGLGI